jgi:hypothetical protein
MNGNGRIKENPTDLIFSFLCDLCAAWGKTHGHSRQTNDLPTQPD